MLEYKPLADCDISSACEDAIEMAINNHQDVFFDFNDIRVDVTSDTTASEALKIWNDESDRRHEAYLNSPEYVKDQRESKARLDKSQKQLDLLMTTFPTALKTQQKLCKWLNDFTDMADHIGVSYDQNFIIESIERVGYVSNAHVSKDTNVRAKLKTNHVVMGEYLIGQALDGMKHGMGPHQMFMTMYKRDYLPMVKAAKNSKKDC